MARADGEYPDGLVDGPVRRCRLDRTGWSLSSAEFLRRRSERASVGQFGLSA
jgi:hypothetical protein